MTSTSGLKKRGEIPPQAPNQQKSIIEIYTDWANHYLDKLHGGRKKVKDLQTELQDGLILAEVIEAVMSQKVPEIHKKPKSPGQMVENLQNCLNFLAKKGVAVQDIQALDIKDGHLKAILGLFFQLSRFKQQQKMILQERSSTPKIPSVPASPARGASAIPSPIHRSTTKPGLSRIPAPPGQRSMLDKLRSGAPAPLRDVKKGLGKRTSSSSGFSSARSIGSESSISLSSDTNFPSPSALRRINETGQGGNSPKNKRSIPIKAQSPKRSPKLQPRNTEIKDYGPVDGHQYPPHHANNKNTNIPKVSKIPSSSSSKISSRIPAAKSNAEVAVDKSKLGIEIVTTVNKQDKQALPLGENEAELASQMSASLQSKNKSLPRTKRREESPGPSNVAVVSPMPSSKTDEELDIECSSVPSQHKKEESIVVNEDQALKALVPLGPLGLFPATKKATHQLPFSSHRMEPLTTLATFSSHQPSGAIDGYMSDGDAFNHKSLSPNSPHYQAHSPPSQSSIDDGYLSEGGASFYAKKIQNRIAIEKQKTVEEQNRKLEEFSSKRPLPGLPDVLGNSEMTGGGNSNPIYRVVGGRNKPKSEAGMQTESNMTIKQSVQEHYDWKQAMAYNAKVLSSQEKAMDDYLRRQRASAEQHMQQMYQRPSLDGRHRSFGTREAVRLQEPVVKMPLTGLGPRHGPTIPSSTPATPTGRRRNGNESSHSRNASPSRQPMMDLRQGGSLERNPSMKIRINAAPNYVSDSEYGQIIGTNGGSSSPGSLRKNNNNNGSKSLPKGASSLNYGLMLDKIQQKRRMKAANDGSLSDSNYAVYEPRNYSWLQPASTYNMGLQPEYGTPRGQLESHHQHLELSSDIMGSNESLNSVSSSIQQARANSLTKARLLLHQQQITRSSQSPSKSRSVVSSSEKSYSSLSTNRNQQETDYYGIPMNYNRKDTKSNGTYASLPPVIAEEKADAEILKLRKELSEEHEKVLNLTSQLATNAHVVAAFEQSLSNMTSRLQHLTSTSEKKDYELNELRRKIDLFKQCGVDAGLISQNHDVILRQQTDLVSDSGDEGGGPSSTSKPKSKRSGWLRNSFSKAFTKGSSKPKGSISDAEESPKRKVYSTVRAASALGGNINSTPYDSPIKASKSSDTIDGNANVEVVNELKRQLAEKENLLTETRLEALSSAHQLESLRDTVTKMRNELMSVRCENEKLHTIVQHSPRGDQGAGKSLNSSQNSLNNNQDQEDRRHSSTLSESSICSGPSSLDLSSTTDPANKEGGKLVPVVVLNNDKSFTRIGTVSVSGRSNWDLLDSLVHRVFKEYVMRVDPTSNLGLNAESIGFYQVGEIRRNSNFARKPELLPYGYLVGDATDIVIALKKSENIESLNVDALAFETLIPKSIIQRYVSLLIEHKRIIISGPEGSGKTYMASKMANFITNRTKKSVVTFSVQRNNVPEMKDFLHRMRSTGQDQVIILDCLNNAGKLDEVLQDVILPPESYIIGTFNPMGSPQAQTPTHLQIQHDFRIVQLSTHTEPLKGLVGRCLRQRLLNIEVKTRMLDGETSAAVDWVAKAHLHLNKILESHASGDDANLSPKLFLDCPIGHDEGLPEVQGDQIRRWFLDLWQSKIQAKLMESIRDGLQMYGHRSHWEDPVEYLIQTWPWANSAPLDLPNIDPQDVGYDQKKSPDVQPRPSSTGTSLSSGSGGTNTNESDPLFNMLLHLQEAANNETAIN